MSTEEKASTALWRRAFRGALDGGPAWGRFLAQSGRYGAMTYRLTVYPPGVSAEQRRRIRLWQLFALWGGAVWVALELVLQLVLDPWVVLAISTGVTVGLGVAAYRAAGPARSLVRRMYASTLAGFDDAEVRAAREKVLTLADALLDADQRRRDGLISAVDHEMIWWQVYDEMGDHRLATDVRADG